MCQASDMHTGRAGKGDEMLLVLMGLGVNMGWALDAEEQWLSPRPKNSQWSYGNGAVLS